jgi:hypothetical protein
LGFKWYFSTFANYQKTYGSIGGVMVTLLWFYVSGLAMLIGAEMNAIIEHASPLGKDPGEKVPGQHESEQLTAPATAHEGNARRLLSPGCVRPSEALIGGTALAIEVAALIIRHLRRIRRREHGTDGWASP